MTADRFVAKHLKSIEGSSILFRSSQLRNDVCKEKFNKQRKAINFDVCSDHETDMEPEKGFELHTAVDFNAMPDMEIYSNSKDEDLTSDSKSISEYDDSLESDISVFEIKTGSIIKKGTCNNSDVEEMAPFGAFLNSDSSVSENSLNSVENWRGLGKLNTYSSFSKKYHRKKEKEIRHTWKLLQKSTENFAKKSTRSTLNSLLINGNIATPLHVAEKRFLVINTYPFDALDVILTIAYTNIPLYKQYIDTCKQMMLKFCKNLAILGP